MQKQLKRFSQLGTSGSFPKWKNRNIVITNNISMVFILLLTCLCLVQYNFNTNDRVIQVVGTMIAALCLLPFLQHLGFNDTSRTLITITMILGTLSVTIVNKMSNFSNLSLLSYYQSRTALIILSIVPLMTISFVEKRLLFLNVSICFLTLMLYDPIHNFLGVGYYQVGFTDTNYNYINFVTIILFTAILSIVGFFKYETDVLVQRNEHLIENLSVKNIKIEEQSEELTSQSEILKELLAEKDNDLLRITNQLVSFNHELLQFSYTISHNLRGPVARILGLINLVNNYASSEEREGLMKRILAETDSLDTIIHELNKIVEVRSDSFIVRGKVEFPVEVSKILQLLDSNIKQYSIEVATDFNIPSIFSAHKRINFILHTLICNSIQFRNPEKKSFVKIVTRMENEWIVVDVVDNGRGIDLQLYGDQLFKPFRYFHPDASGRGINLYLAKLQAVRLGGRIEVSSIPERGSTFSLYLKEWT